MAKAEDNEGAETKANGGARARATTKIVARTKASEAMAKTNEDEVAEATKNGSAEVREDVVAKTSDNEAAETWEETGTETKQDIRTVNICDFQKLGTEQLASNTTAPSSFLETVQAIALNSGAGISFPPSPKSTVARAWPCSPIYSAARPPISRFRL